METQQGTSDERGPSPVRPGVDQREGEPQERAAPPHLETDEPRPQEIDLSILAGVRGLAGILAGCSRLFLSHAERLQKAPVGPEPPNTEEPEQGVALLASELRCLVADAIEPARARLEALLTEWTLHEQETEE
jgi:hypothetical protein